MRLLFFLILIINLSSCKTSYDIYAKRTKSNEGYIKSNILLLDTKQKFSMYEEYTKEGISELILCNQVINGEYIIQNDTVVLKISTPIEFSVSYYFDSTDKSLLYRKENLFDKNDKHAKLYEKQALRKLKSKNKRQVKFCDDDNQ